MVFPRDGAELVGRRLDVAPRPLELVARIARRPGACLMWSADGSGPSFVACDPLAHSDALDPEPALRLAANPTPYGVVPRWIGVVPYEAMRQLERPLRDGGRDERPPPRFTRPSWLRYGAVAVITDHVTVVGDAPPEVRALCDALSGPPIAFGEAHLALREQAEPRDAHRARVERALQYIVAGDVYQVNLARRLPLECEGTAAALLAKLGARSRPAYGIALDLPDGGVVGTSPEGCLETHADGRAITRPIKGTRPRGRDAEEDRELARELDLDEKERAELAMVIDVERNDLGRIATIGSVELVAPPRVVTHGMVHHREATVMARLRPDVDRSDILRAMLPSGSVTGAPKVRAMELIAMLERDRRGLYTGAYGALCHDGGLRLAMAIRTLSFGGSEGEYHVGGGIVVDSDPEREAVETTWKAAHLGLGPESG